VYSKRNDSGNKKCSREFSPGKIFIAAVTSKTAVIIVHLSHTITIHQPRELSMPAYDKEMLLIKFVKNNGKEIGCLNWYAIHPTNRGNKNRLITGDNKGYASYLFEKEKGTNIKNKETFIAAFANSNCGDISGNVKYGIPDLIHDFARMQEFGERRIEKLRSFIVQQPYS